MDISKNIIKYMNKNKIHSIRQLSIVSEVPYSTLKKIMQEKNNDIMLSTAIRLSKALNISVDQLVK